MIRSTEEEEDGTGRHVACLLPFPIAAATKAAKAITGILTPDPHSLS